MWVVALQQIDDMMAVYEPIFYRHGVDAVLSGHAHAYERSYPMYNWTGKEPACCATRAIVQILMARLGTAQGGGGGETRGSCSWLQQVVSLA